MARTIGIVAHVVHHVANANGSDEDFECDPVRAMNDAARDGDTPVAAGIGTTNPVATPVVLRLRHPLDALIEWFRNSRQSPSA
ncbi:MAG: hypothetical protein NVS3B12_30920 [Acidimicrobiales bacterium]